MATRTLQKRTVNVVLYISQVSGESKYVYIPIGFLDDVNYNDNQVLAIVSALAPCFSKSIYRVEETTIHSLSVA